MTERRLRLVVGAAALLGGFALWIGLLAVRDARLGDDFDFTRWELTTLGNKWLHALGAPLRDDPPADEAIAAYFALDDSESSAARDLENAVEAAIEGRIDDAVRASGLDAPLPLPGPLAVWPPVDVELSDSPHVLVVSPRAEVRRLHDGALRLDLGSSALLDIERATEANDPDVSALIVRSGGVAAYPAIITTRGSYRDTLSNAAHEWTHHYLSFFPLGRAYFRNADTRAINETVADVVGDELAAIAVDRSGDPTSPAPSSSSARPSEIDRNEVLRELRLEVDALLADGRIEEAERRMAEVRDLLSDHGIEIRRINQAYFAWYGSYAARPDSVDPLGDQVREIRERAGSLDRFLALIRGTTTREAVEALLDELRAVEG